MKITRSPVEARFSRATFRAGALALMLSLAGSSAGAAASAGTDSASAAALKAAFLVNFVRFTEWRDLQARAPIIMCLVTDLNVEAALVGAIKGQSIDGHPLIVSQLTGDVTARACHLLFVPRSHLQRAASTLDEARGLPILTVSDGDRFSRSGGLIEFFVADGRMRFAINVDAVQRSQIRLSSRLLSLAKIVKDNDAQ